MSQDLLTPLADYSRQHLLVGTPPHDLFDANNVRHSIDLAALSVQLRIAEALEAQVELLRQLAGQQAGPAEQPEEFFKPEEIEVITENVFLAVYRRCVLLLRERASSQLATYQRRGAEGHEWFYANPIYAARAARGLEFHLRLNVADDGEYGRSWQLLYAHDTSPNDVRRVASSQEEFEQQLALLLAELEAAATGQEGGPANG